jgi:hypothetical protein
VRCPAIDAITDEIALLDNQLQLASRPRWRRRLRGAVDAVAVDELQQVASNVQYATPCCARSGTPLKVYQVAAPWVS